MSNSNNQSTYRYAFALPSDSGVVPLAEVHSLQAAQRLFQSFTPAVASLCCLSVYRLAHSVDSGDVKQFLKTSETRLQAVRNKQKASATSATPATSNMRHGKDFEPTEVAEVTTSESAETAEVPENTEVTSDNQSAQ